MRFSAERKGVFKCVQINGVCSAAMNGVSVAALSASQTKKRRVLSIIGKAIPVFIVVHGTFSLKTRQCHLSSSACKESRHDQATELGLLQRTS